MKEHEQKKKLIGNMAGMAKGYFSSTDFDTYILPIYNIFTDLLTEYETQIIQLNRTIEMLQAEKAGGKDKV